MAGVYIKSLSAYVPERAMATSEAISAGLYSAERNRVDGFTAVRIEETLSAPDMALAAARPLVGRADAAAVGALYLCSIHRHGHKLLWPPASYLQHRLELPTTARVMGISQGCNGAFIAASLACDMIGAGLSGDHLVIASDRFSGSGFDRFGSDLGTLYGDAAVAARFGPDGGRYRVLALVTEAEPALEEMYRDHAPADEGPTDHDIKSAKRAYLDRLGRDHFDRLFVAALGRLRDRLLVQFDLRRDPARTVIYPNVGAGLSAQLYARAFGDLARSDHWAFGRSVGHLGSADQFVGLWDIDGTDPPDPGERLLLIGAGNGLSLAAMLLEKT